MPKDKIIFGSRKDYISVLTDLFNGVKNQIKPLKDNLNPWFLIRIQTGYFFHLIYSGKFQLENDITNFNSPTIINVSFIQEIKNAVKQLLLLFKIKKQHKLLKNKLKNRILYLGYQSHNIKEGKYNIYLHPFYEDETEKGEIFYLDLIHNNSELQSYFQLLIKYYALKGKDKFQNLAYENTSLVSDFLSKEKGIEINKLNSNNFSTLNSYVMKLEAYKQFLKTINPSKLFFYCYYDLATNAMSFAANELNIPTVEYQHSNITDTHFAYAKWEIPNMIKFHFPKIFYVWEESDKNLILNNFSDREYSPEVEVIGNRYLQKSIEKSTGKRLENNNSILISLQGQWIPEFLEDFIYKDQNYTWYFRLHPRYPQDNILLQNFASKKGNNVIVEQANTLELYDLFAEISILMTSFSGTALEAEKFGKKVIIFGEEGYNSYQNKIENGTYSYIEKTEDINQKLLPE